MNYDETIDLYKDNYSGLPDELKDFSYYDDDLGHIIMAIPECLLEEAEGSFNYYEVPIPTKYVLEKGYRIYKDHIICDVKCHQHDTEDEFWIELDISDEWFEVDGVESVTEPPAPEDKYANDIMWYTHINNNK